MLLLPEHFFLFRLLIWLDIFFPFRSPVEVRKPCQNIYFSEEKVNAAFAAIIWIRIIRFDSAMYYNIYNAHTADTHLKICFYFCRRGINFL